MICESPKSAGKEWTAAKTKAFLPLYHEVQGSDQVGQHGAVTAAHICSRVCSFFCFLFVSARVATLHPIKSLAVTLHSDSASRHLKHQHWKIHSQPSQPYLLSLPLTPRGTSFLPMKLWLFVGIFLLYSPTNSITNHSSIKQLRSESELWLLPKKWCVSQYWTSKSFSDLSLEGLFIYFLALQITASLGD